MTKGEVTNRDEVVIITGGGYDCGGRCLFKVHVKNGKAIRVESDDGDEPQLRACVRGRAYRKTVYAPDRLNYPMKRVGARGEGRFERISWDEALDSVATELLRVKKTYGTPAIFCLNVLGATGALYGASPVYRLLNMFGGSTREWGNPSAGAADFAQEVMYGTQATCNTIDDPVNSRLIVLWGVNPAVTIQGTNASFYLAKAKEAGARIICVDPRFTESAILADQWIPIRPGTDTAMLIAMANVMIRENLQDQKFLDSYTIGFKQFRDYLMGVEDGLPKTPAWAEPITGAPSTTIEKLAREYAISRPAALLVGRAPGRTAYGEQFHRATIALAAMTGNIGISGGSAGGVIGRAPMFFYHSGRRLPQGDNPIEAGAASTFLSTTYLKENIDPSLRNRTSVNFARVWDAILHGKAGGYPADTKLLYIVAHNALNQLPNTNKGVQALSKPEFIVVQDQFLTATARFADILLPANTFWERNDIIRPYSSGTYQIYGNKAIDSMHESKSDFEICRELAPRLGIANYDEGKTEDEWLKEILKLTKDLPQDFPDYETFKAKGVYKMKLSGPVICFKEQIEDPEHHPFPTPSGKIEIFSPRLANLGNPKLPPIPKYIETWESPTDPLARKYPLQLVTHHFKTRAHSCFDNNPWLKNLEPQTVWINTSDARIRSISDGDKVRVFNDRGMVIPTAKITERIMPGVVAIGEGAWYQPDESGTDTGGCANTLTRDEYSPGGGPTYNTSLVQVQKT